MATKAQSIICLSEVLEEGSLLQLVSDSSLAKFRGKEKQALPSFLKNIGNLLESEKHWVIEETKGKSFSWNLKERSLKEKIELKFSEYLEDKDHIQAFHLKDAFLMYSHHLIIPLKVSNSQLFIGFSFSEKVEVDNPQSNEWEIISNRLYELCEYDLAHNESHENFDYKELFDKSPQAIIFNEYSSDFSWVNSEAKKLLKINSGDFQIKTIQFKESLENLKERVLNRDEVEMMGNNILNFGDALPSSFGEDWIWKFNQSALKVNVKNVAVNGKEGRLWIFDNVSELYHSNERLNALYRTLNVAYNEINANLTEFQSKSSTGKSITDLEAEESRIIQQYDNNDILGKVTHDLRTPFAKVYTIVQLLLSDNQENLSKQQVERINLIKQIVADGLQIVKGFLDTGNMVLDEKKYKPTVIQIEDFINENLVPYELLSAKKNIIFITQVDDDNIKVEADRTYLKRIIDNLVSNAIKFSPYDKMIYFSVNRVDEDIIFSVKDEGPGLTEDDKSRLFKKYQQLSAKPIGTDETTGLGLFIVKSMVDKMGGEIWVESEKDKGANFKVKFPAYKS